MPLRVFIGWDSREAECADVLAYSLRAHASVPLDIRYLKLSELDFNRPHDNLQSTEFTYSRFLVPHLTGWTGWALYIDGDMLLRDDVAEIFTLKDESKAVLCVHHDYKTKLRKKYLGARNEDYPRKNWSSVMLWNCAHPANRALTPEFVQNATGAQLHRFTWLADELIGELPKEWNWLPDELGPNEHAKLVHWTLGAPCFREFADEAMAEEWHRERGLLNTPEER